MRAGRLGSAGRRWVYRLDGVSYPVYYLYLGDRRGGKIVAGPDAFVEIEITGSQKRRPDWQKQLDRARQRSNQPE